VYSLNVPVPARVAALASDIAAELPMARARARGEHTLGVKRLAETGGAYNRIEARTRELLRGQPAFEIRVTDVDIFTDPPIGSAPVIYLAVESEALVALHERLAEVFDPVDTQIEGVGYTPHVTIARGGDLAAARQAASREIDPITWTVSELTFWDAKRSQSISSVSLPA
jgi:2'-5' RNA ligase